MSTATLAIKSTRSTARDPETVELSARGDDSFGALSSDGQTIYDVRPVAGGFTCTCKGFAARASCCHTLAASRARTCEHCGHTSAGVTDFVSRNDGSAFVLCSDRAACLARQGVR